MKVFKISTLAKPPQGRYRDYAGLGVSEKDSAYVREVGSGRPFPTEWHPIQLWIDTPHWPRPDIYAFGPGAFVCSDRVVELLGEPLEMAGELLPITIEGESGNFFVYNVTNSKNVFDTEKATWRINGPLRHIVKYAFKAERFGEESLFKIPEDCDIDIYCLERTGNADEGEFKALVERHQLTGIEFELVWTDE